MKYSIGVALFAIATLAPLQAALATGETAEQQSPQQQREEAAYEMLVVQNGGTKISTALTAALRQQMGDAYRMDATMLALENEHPGLIEHLLKSTLPIILRQVNASMPDLLRRQARYYADNLTRADIAAITAFYSHPAYPVIRAKVESNVDMSKMMNDAIRNPEQEFEITTDDLSDMNTDAANDSMADFTAAERLLLNRFDASPAGKKMVALEKGALAIEAEWSNESTPEEDKEIEDATLKALIEYTGEDFAQ
jgi:hypothetical protein